MCFVRYFKTCILICPLFLCGLTFVFWLIYKRKLSSSKCIFEEDTSKNTCNSLSCIRCSNSVFSSKKLLEKWGVIQKTLQPDHRLSQRIGNAISRDNSYQATGNQAPTIFYLDELPSKAWYTAEDFSREISILERKSSLDAIASEFLEIYQNLNAGWVANKVTSGGWYLFYLVNQGVKIKENCKRCPKTMKLIGDLPLLLSDCAFGNVMFSVLLPRTKISQHCGPSNVRIRCHVPIKVPDGYFISVAGEERSWKENKVLIFDDSFYHEVYHRGDGIEPRVVLMIDLWHSCLTFQEKEIIRTLFSLNESV